MKKSDRPTIVYLGTYPPRECGIATFTKDITESVGKNLFPQMDYKIVAMNSNGTNVYNYSDKVLFEINDKDINEYSKVARKINKMDNVKLVNIQHEFGIFGGDYGNYLIAFLDELQKPVVITLHSILPDPDKDRKKIVRQLAEKSDAFIVMAEKGIEILREDYGITNKIFFVPHGIPFIPFESNIHEKKNLGYPRKIILSSFGMINRGKGYEYAIGALPEVVKKFPNLMYLIVGETHPVVRKHEGEKYRNYLERKVRKLGLQNNVKFYNKYVKLHEIIRYLKASDIYISASLDPNQITSGTLVYAMGAGRPVISTPFAHAKEIVNNDRGRLVDFKNSESFKESINELLSNRYLRKRLELNSYHYTRQMTWPNVALGYENVFGNYISMPQWRKNRIPEIKFSHLINLTDNFGVAQFAKNYKPELRYGYTTDDIARALVASCMSFKKENDSSKLNLIKTYLNYIKYVQDSDGKFFNYVDKNKKINTQRWSDDAHGRALWSLGYTLSTQEVPESMKEKSSELFDKALPLVDSMASLRAIAFTILGSHFYQTYEPSQNKQAMIRNLSNKLISMYNENKEHDWKWFEDALTYDNSRIPEALLYAYLSIGDEKYLNVGLEALDFLSNVSFKQGIFIPIGQEHWYKKNSYRSEFDQQPIDVGSMVQALVLAHNITRKKVYNENAFKTFNWFLGKNSLNQIMYDDYTGGCYDGIGKECININQGAESTISYLLARLSINEIGNKTISPNMIKCKTQIF